MTGQGVRVNAEGSLASVFSVRVGSRYAGWVARRARDSYVGHRVGGESMAFRHQSAATNWVAGEGLNRASL